jgi:hypothetical protein
MQLIAALYSEKAIFAFATEERIVARIAHDQVVSIAGENLIVAIAANQSVIFAAAKNDVIAALAAHETRYGHMAAVNGVVAFSAIDDDQFYVIDWEASEATAQADDQVGARVSYNYGIVAAGSADGKPSMVQRGGQESAWFERVNIQ